MLDFVLLLVGLEEHAGLVEDRLVGEDRHLGAEAHRERDRIRRPRRDPRLGAFAVELDLGVEGAVVQGRDLDPVDRHRETVEHGLEQVVGHRPRRLHPLQGVDDRRRLRRPDEDRQEAGAALFAQQHDRLIRRDLDAHTDQRQANHGASVGTTVTLPPGLDGESGRR